MLSQLVAFLEWGYINLRKKLRYKLLRGSVDDIKDGIMHADID